MIVGTVANGKTHQCVIFPAGRSTTNPFPAETCMFPVPWTERKLVYDRPPSELPVLLERVQGTSARLSELLARQPLETVHLSVQGKWSVIEHVGHLITLQDRFEGRVEDFEYQRPSLCDINLSDQEPIIRGHRLRSVGDVLEEFRLKRQAFAKRVEGLHKAAMEHVAYHPCQGTRMRPVDMLHWIAEHDDHHLASMRALVRTVRGQVRPDLWPS